MLLIPTLKSKTSSTHFFFGAEIYLLDTVIGLS